MPRWLPTPPKLTEGPGSQAFDVGRHQDQATARLENAFALLEQAQGVRNMLDYVAHCYGIKAILRDLRLRQSAMVNLQAQ